MNNWIEERVEKGEKRGKRLQKVFLQILRVLYVIVQVLLILEGYENVIFPRRLLLGYQRQG